MSSPRLEAYLRLENILLELDALDDPLADRFRDLMDPIWYALTDDEHEILDARETAMIGEPQLRISVGESLFIPPRDPVPTVERDPPPPIEHWDVEAA